MTDSVEDASTPEGVGENDVLLGRGGGTNHHHGNKAFRALVAEYQEEYLRTRKREKVAIARKIVALIQERGGRFMKKESENDADSAWVPVPDKRATEKASQALRENLDVRNHRVKAKPEKRKAKQPKVVAAPKRHSGLLLLTRRTDSSNGPSDNTARKDSAASAKKSTSSSKKQQPSTKTSASKTSPALVSKNADDFYQQQQQYWQCYYPSMYQQQQQQQQQQQTPSGDPATDRTPILIGYSYYPFPYYPPYGYYPPSEAKANKSDSKKEHDAVYEV